MAGSPVVAAWERIEHWLSAHAPPLLANLNDGASPEDLSALEAQLGVQLPDDLRESLARHNGQLDEFPPLIGGWSLLSCSEIAQEWKIWKDLLARGDLAHESSPSDPRVRSDWWNERWVPFTYSGSGDHHCADCAPADGGAPGQVIVLWHDDAARPLVAPTFTAWLEQIAEGLESGKLQAFEDNGDWVTEPGGFLLESGH